MGWFCWFCLVWFLLAIPVQIEMAVQVIVEPDGCVCPSQSFICKADRVREMEIDNDNLTDPFLYDTGRDSRRPQIEKEGLRVLFTEISMENGLANLTTQLFIIDKQTWNKTIFTCGARHDGDGQVTKDIFTCVTGPASAPTDLSVECDTSSAVVSFQSPVYGGECVDHYIITATSEEEERNASCDNTRDESRHSCGIFLDGSANDYNFTVYAVTRVNDSFIYNGSIATDCCLRFPENVTVKEEKCGLKYLLNISWKVISKICIRCLGDLQNSSMNTTISWRRVHSSVVTSYERASSKDSHLLTLDYSETGQMEIAVTFSSPVCRKTTVTHYLVEEILRNVSLNSTTLVIESRDCIGSRENYRIVVTSTDTPSTELVDVSFSPSIEHDVGDVVKPNTQYTIRVQLVETTSGTTINEITTTIMYTSNTPTPSSEPGVTDAVQPTTDGDVATFVAVGVAVGGVLVGLVVGAVVAVFVMVVVMRKKLGDSVRGTGCSSSKDTEMSAVNVAGQSQETAGVVYETVGGVGATTGPATSENVAYGVPDTVPTSHNPAYSHLPTKK